MIKECYEILERYLHEWVSTGEMYLHRDMEMKDVERHILIGKAMKKAHMACRIAKELDGGEAEHHELALPRARQYEPHSTMKAQA